jgi:lauroyl/myristoyl acyltransferase
MGDRPIHRRGFFHAAELCFSTAMLLVPRRYRFGAAMLIARVAVPLFRRTYAYREQERIGFDGPHEIALHFVLNALTRKGTRFDSVIDVKGYEEFERAYATGKGVLVIGPHAALTLLMIRHFYDRGLDPVVVSPDPLMRVGGTKVTARTLQPSPTFLVKMRSSLRRGELVCAMPDRAEHHGARTVEFATANGRVIVAPALTQVAARCGAKVIFTEVHMEGHGLVGTIAAPSAASGGAADAIIKDFMRFVRERAWARPTRQG